MKENQKDYQNYLLELISMIKDKSTYLKSIDKSTDGYNEFHFQGMADAYFFILDGIKDFIESHEELSLEEFGLEDYDPREILTYKPV
jgi:hypothetical protein